MITLLEQGGMTLPVGAGMGATQPGCEVRSFSRAAGRPQWNTPVEPMAMIPGPFGTQLGSLHGSEMLPTTAACLPLIITVGTHAVTMVHGSGGCATGVGVGAGGWMGA